jgi:hypothetical protein
MFIAMYLLKRDEGCRFSARFKLKVFKGGRLWRSSKGNSTSGSYLEVKKFTITSKNNYGNDQYSVPGRTEVNTTYEGGIS